MAVNGKAILRKGMTRVDLYEYFASLDFKVGAEIGVWWGKNARNIFNAIPGVKLYLIDPYRNYQYVQKPRTESRIALAKKMAHRKLRYKNKVWIEALSEDAAKDFEDCSLDFVHIDAEHSYDMTMLDSILWSRKVRKGGIVSGHDYVKARGVGVISAVTDYARVHNLTLYSTDGTAEENRDKRASWFWIKKC